MVQPNIHSKESEREMEKEIIRENTEKGDCRLPLQNARFKRGETNNQTQRLGHFTGPLLSILSSYSPNGIITIRSIQIPEQLLHIQGDAIWNLTLTNIPCNSNRIDNATNKNEDRDQNQQL
ncbi:MAG: hypothetical protein EZS28_021501 [Streblomastix strix]|uniref:Uncharacterized protein n=1 Tax=Streblomastix strix TaxID=222440 RepID=A0A5J4VK63_9EUKA|nr:MAG: hypothetical protein EZS28_021501 [Streblomastix strix]